MVPDPQTQGRAAACLATWRTRRLPPAVSASANWLMLGGSSGQRPTGGQGRGCVQPVVLKQRGHLRDRSFVDFWDDREVDNCRASRDWAQHQVVQVVECAGQFKFAEHTPEPADAFPTATWSSFTVGELDFARCTIEFVGGIFGIDLLLARPAGPAMKRPTTIVVR
ncbi:MULTISPECIES: hypothetical protein [Streptomyces]|uniref:hypothetical protein n=1 Tax=Streptomyces TaxID=1883 RepID=UPI001C52FB7D|nr:hypothetical protein [Streptomyces sp. 2R]